MKSLISLGAMFAPMVYGPAQRTRIQAITKLLADEVVDPEHLLRHDALLQEVEILFSGWGGVALDGPLLSRAPNLKLYLYGGGVPKAIVGPGWTDPRVRLSTSVEQNSFVVAEYTLGAILLGLKRAFSLAHGVRAARRYPPMTAKRFPGNYGSTVGLVALGRTARHLVNLLQPHAHNLIAFDPFVDPSWPARQGITMQPLEEVFRRADVVSIHLPLKRDTKGLIHGDHIRMMPPDATFINTARGAVLDEPSVLAALSERPDVFAVIDVAVAEPPVVDSPFYDLPNVMLTPHVGGALFRESNRLGDAMVDEAERFLRGEPLLYEETVTSVAQT